MRARHASLVFSPLMLMISCSPEGELPVEAPAQGLAAIIDGDEADADEVGATVALVETGYGPVCGGTLIAPRVVVTAAHCVVFGGEVMSPQTLQIAAGITDATSPDDGDLYAVTSIIPHPEFSEWGIYSDDPDGLSDERDIGVIVLAEPVEGVEPAPVLAYDEVDDEVDDGTDIIISGWGMTSINDTEPPLLQIAETPFQRRTAAEFLAGGNGSPDSCFGDSGGPAYVDVGGERYLLGATSRGPSSSDGFCGTGGIYTLVSAFDDWLEEQTDGLYTGNGGADLPPADPMPGPSGDGSCDGYCGGPGSDDYCYCETDCYIYGDCCSDYEEFCQDGDVGDGDGDTGDGDGDIGDGDGDGDTGDGDGDIGDGDGDGDVGDGDGDVGDDGPADAGLAQPPGDDPTAGDTDDDGDGAADAGLAQPPGDGSGVGDEDVDSDSDSDGSPEDDGAGFVNDDPAELELFGCAATGGSPADWSAGLLVMLIALRRRRA